MSMSKKDFIALADEVRGLTDDSKAARAKWEAAQDGPSGDAEHDAAREMHDAAEALEKEIIDRLCRFMRGQNFQFKEGRWRAFLAGECGPGGGAIKKEPTLHLSSCGALRRAESPRRRLTDAGCTCGAAKHAGAR